MPNLRPIAIISLFGFFFTDSATTEIYTLSLHDALPISVLSCYLVLKGWSLMGDAISHAVLPGIVLAFILDRKSTRLNSSHGYISYAVFCLKKKNHHGIRLSISVLSNPLRST